MLIVDGTDERERYTVFVNGKPVGDPVDGNGGTIEFKLEPIEQLTEYVFVVEPIEAPKAKYLPIERRVTLTLDILS